MVALLSSILCVLRNLVLGIVWAIGEVVNLIIAAVGAFAGLVLAVLPQMPAVPAGPTGTAGQATGWLAWLLPVAGIVTAFGAMLTMFGIFMLARVALRWVKAL